MVPDRSGQCILALLKTGSAELERTGSTLNKPGFLTILADAYRLSRKPQDALLHLADAERFAEMTGERFLVAEALALRGTLLNQIGDQGGAEASFRDAIALAQRQSAKLFELRAMVSLARLWRDQGKIGDAQALLAPIYDWFTDGFDAPDLVAAKALLDELAAN
jgi:predicted ATPase